MGMACAAAPLNNAKESAEELAREVVAAVTSRDADRLRAITLSEDEFRTTVWPELPAARPERNLPVSYVWLDLKQKSESSLTAVLATHGHKGYTLRRVEFAGPARDYGGFRVHQNVTFVVRDQAGEDRRVRLCGSLVERQGVWKVFSFVVDD